MSGNPLLTWTATCISLIGNLTEGYVDGNGQPVSRVDNNTWGIDIKTCRKYCNSTAIPLDFNFQVFSSAFQNFLLPWLALTAQLPFETGSPWSNVMSFCMAIGSPALITFSLSLTILNRSWVRQRFDDLHSRAGEGQGMHHKYPEYGNRIRAAQYLLQEAQQVPMRASQESGWLSSLIVVGDNQEWWLRLRQRLRSTRRGVTFSLIAQMLAATLAWLFTIISAFVGFLGDTTTALQISSGSLWVWMIPVIAGWVAVGTQSRPASIAYALRADAAHRALEPPIPVNSQHTHDGEQTGLVARSGLTPQPHRVQTVVGGFQAPPMAHLKVPSWYGADISGDEKRRGPIYNYSRVFTWWQCATSVDRAIDATILSVEGGNNCQRRPWIKSMRAEDNLAGDSFQTAQYCGLATENIQAYTPWNEIPAEVWNRIFAASIAALFVQWGSTGPAIMIAYLTPTIGLGCRSGAYVFYGTMGTVSWFLLASSMLLSHWAMLLYQKAHENFPNVDLRQNIDNPPHQYKRSPGHAVISGAAVLTRHLGKVLVVCNALWLLLTSVFEYVGAYDNCWCKGDVLGLHESGWIVLFKTANELAKAAQIPWETGVATSILVCLLSFTFFWLGCRATGED